MTKRKQTTVQSGLHRAADVLCVLCVCLLPLFTGAVLLRTLVMSGTPLWYCFVQGAAFLGSLGGLLFLLSLGLIPALWARLRPRD